jgi:hypothetical protein
MRNSSAIVLGSRYAKPHSNGGVASLFFSGGEPYSRPTQSSAMPFLAEQ